MENGQEDLLDYLKLDPDHHEKIAALIPKETWYEQIIRYGLYVGAVFQMVCILAVILLPEKDQGDGDGETSFSDEEEMKSRAGSPSHFNATKKHKKKHDRKKKQL
jgi:preprotein translocase subunit Sec61beta